MVYIRERNKSIKMIFKYGGIGKVCAGCILFRKEIYKKFEARCPLSKVGAELGQALVKVIVGLSATEFRYRVSHNEYNLTCSLISQKPWNGITNIFSTACPLGTAANVLQDVYSIPDPVYNIPDHMGPLNCLLGRGFVDNLYDSGQVLSEES